MASNECSCNKCVRACKNTPGWFAPGEAEGAASLFGVPFEEFFRKYLVVDFWEGDDDTNGDTILVLSPVKASHLECAGRKAPFNFPFIQSPCVFLKDDRCSIHAKKPKECRDVMCDGKDGRIHREAVRDLWMKPELQKELAGLLGHTEV